jgi:hypothetical protein
MNERVEIRWLCKKTKPYHKSLQLQYREFIDVGGPYPNYQWTEWKTVPEVWEEEERNENT